MDLTRPTNLFFKRFATSTGGKDLTLKGAGSTSPNNFEVSPSTAKFQLAIQRVNFVLVDGGLQYGKFGGLNALTNGLKVRVLDSSTTVLIDFLDGETIKTNEDFNLLAGVDAIVEPTAGDDAMPVRWTIAKAGKAVVLQQGDRLQIQVQDATSALTKFTAMAQGWYYSKGTD